MLAVVGAAGARLVTGFVIPGDPLGCSNVHEKPTEKCAQREENKNQLHATANVQGQCLWMSSVKWLKVSSESGLLAAKPLLQNPIASVHFRIVSATHSYISGKFGSDFGLAVSF